MWAEAAAYIALINGSISEACMRRAVVLVATLLIASLAVVGQSDQASQSSGSSTSAAGSNDNAQRTVQITGCLRARPTGGEYTLTEPSGAAYTLTGNTDSL